MRKKATSPFNTANNSAYNRRLRNFYLEKLERMSYNEIKAMEKHLSPELISSLIKIRNR